MLQYFKGLRAGAVLSVAVLLLSLAPQLAEAQNLMKVKSVKVKTKAKADVTDVESVNFDGLAVVNSRLATDAEFGKPSLVMQFDLTGVTGIGAKSGIRYLITNEEHVNRPHALSQDVEFSFPMATDENAPIAKVRTGLARFVMNVDLGTGTITSVDAVLMAQ